MPHNLIRHFVILLFLTVSSFDSIGQQSNQSTNLSTSKANLTSFKNLKDKDAELWLLINGEKWKAHPEFGSLPFDAPCNNCVEVYEKRTEYERYFVDKKDNSHFYLQKGLGKLHFLKDGFLQTISHRIRETHIGVFEAKNQLEPVTIDLNNGHTLVRTSKGEVKFNQWQMYGSKSGSKILLAQADYSNFTAGDDGVYIKDIFPGIDAEIKLALGRTETDFIVRENHFSNYDTLFFHDTYGASLIGMHFLYFKDKNSVAIKHRDNELLNIAAPVTYTISDFKSTLEYLSFELSDSGIAIVAPVVWLNDKLKRGNVVIDPLVTSSATMAQADYNSSRYSQSCTSPSGSGCSHFLSITPPANATFTDIRSTHSYETRGGCVYTDGVMRLSLGNCSTGVMGCHCAFWLPNPCPYPNGDQVPGECFSNNLSYFQSLGSCLPAPSCNPSPITFNLEIIRCASPGGCNGSCVGSGRDWIITIEGRTLEFSSQSNPVSVSPNSLCMGESVFSSTSGIYGVPPYQYSWSCSSGGNFVSSSGGSAIFNFPNPGSYDISVTITDACGITQASQRSITVHPLPTINASIVPSVVCFGDAVSFIATGAVNYYWSNGGIGSPYQTIATQSGTYFVTGIDANGCSSTDSTALVVNPLPTAVISSSPGEICFGDTAILSASGGISYAWSLPATVSDIQVSPDSTTSYSVTVTDANSCTNSSSYTLIVNPLPLVKINPDTTRVCYGKSVMLTGLNAVNYVWNTGETSAIIYPTPLATAVYSVTGTDSKNCKNKDSVSIIVHPLPIPDIIQLNEQQCYGSYVDIRATAGVRYIWSSGDSTNTTTVYPTSNTTYYVTVTDINNCSEDTSILISAKPPYLIDTVTKNPPCWPADIGYINVNVSGSNGGYAYLWNTGEVVPNIDSLGPGFYSILISDSLGCDTTLTFSLDYDYILDVIGIPADTIVPAGAYFNPIASVNVNNQVKYSWQPDNTFLSCKDCSTPVFRVFDDGLYMVKAIDKYGCIDSAFVKVDTVYIDNVFIPNAFTPNGDGVNDYFQIFGAGIRPDYMKSFEIQIFNRVGEKVFESNQPDFKWDGKYKGQNLQGVFVYVIKYILEGIYTPEFRKGSITIMH